MSSITDRINALQTFVGADGVPMVSIEAVLAVAKNAIPVEIDMDMYSESSADADDEQKEALAVISTAYNLLADTSAKFAARAVRAKMEAAGIELIADEQMFAIHADDPTAIRSYHDLAPHNPTRVEELATTFQALVDESTREATMGMLLSLRGDE